MASFFIEFKNDSDELTLEFEIANNSTAAKWYQELEEQLARNSNLKENNRLYHFPNETWSLENIVNELNKRIVIINGYQQYIPMTADVTVDQDQLNQLHSYFEEMRGGILSPGQYYTNAPWDIKQAIEDYNVLIHRTEDKLNAKQARPRMVLTFHERVRHLLEDSDYDNFTLDINFGDVFVNYCEVGKPLWDVFKDKDHVVGDDNIRPLKWYSADMHIYFTKGGYNSRIDKFWQWFTDNEEFLNSLGFHIYDKKLAIGHIPVARIKTTMTNQDVVEAIAKFDNINRVYI